MLASPSASRDLPASLADLRQALDKLVRSPTGRGEEILSTGAPALDRCLPLGGLRAGSLVEYLGGGGSLALAAARAACQSGRALVIVDRAGRFYAPAAASFGLNLTRLVLVRPATAADELWTLTEALRCPGIGAVWSVCPRLAQRDFRRLQLAAETGGTLGLLMRPAKVRSRPTWAEVQWLVEPQPARERWRMRVALVRCRGAHEGQSVLVEWDETSGTWQEADHANSLPSSAELAGAASARRRAAT
jgi:protein ImuA